VGVQLHSQGGQFHLRLIAADAAWGGERHVIYAMTEGADDGLYARVESDAEAMNGSATLSLGVASVGPGRNPNEEPTFGSTRTVQVTLGLRRMAAAILTFALVAVLGVVVAVGQLTASTRNRSSRLIVIDAGPTWTGNVSPE
jgi:hypothetical protein